MKHLFLAFFIAMLFALSAPQSLACSCGAYGMEQAFDESRAVFVGEVIEITKPRTNDPKALPTDRLYQVKFKVERTWKGLGFQEITVPEVIILSDQGGAGCFSWGSFSEGRKYLVYADATCNQDLAVLSCTNRTATLALASEDLQELKRREFNLDFTHRSLGGIEALNKTDFKLCLPNE